LMEGFECSHAGDCNASRQLDAAIGLWLLCYNQGNWQYGRKDEVAPMVVHERLYSAEELWELSHRAENSGRHLEVLEGVLYDMSPTGWLHGDLASELDMQVRVYVKQHQLGRVTAAETGYLVNRDPAGRDTVLAPDVGFIAAGRIPATLPDGYVPFAPDLAVEVVSPGNTQEEINLKIESYLRYRTRLVWIIYPREQRIHAYTPSQDPSHASVEFLTIDDSLDGRDVLPGFRVSVRALFGD
jgi:Uma2 family endonuclease